MVLNSLVGALLFYSGAIIYQLLNFRTLKLVFLTGIRYFLTAFILLSLLQLLYYLYKDYQSSAELKSEEFKEEIDTEDQKVDNVDQYKFD